MYYRNSNINPDDLYCFTYEITFEHTDKVAIAENGVSNAFRFVEAIENGVEWEEAMKLPNIREKLKNVILW